MSILYIKNIYEKLKHFIIWNWTEYLISITAVPKEGTTFNE